MGKVCPFAVQLSPLPCSFIPPLTLSPLVNHGWITGYGDGSFRADYQITRAEVVTLVDRLLGRVADLEYVSDNLRKLNTFPDVSRRYWAYSDILEAANAHNALMGTEESWYK